MGTGTCDDSERYPGLWEFPLWSVQDADGSVIASMDPQASEQRAAICTVLACASLGAGPRFV